ncbi:MAG: PPC domain-containing protein [Planctomycetota bacterium]
MAKFVVFFLTLVVTSGLALAQFPQIETEIVSADPSPTLLSYGQWSAGSISIATDIDIFVFQGSLDEQVIISVDGLSTNLDISLRLIDPAGVQLNAWTCSANGFNTCSLFVGDVLQSSGIHTLVVQDSGSDNTGNYRISLEQAPPQLSAPLIPSNFNWTDSISPTTDVDWVAFAAQPGDQIQINIDGLTTNLDMFAAVYAPDGSVFASQACSANGFNTCSLTMTLSGITVAGIYHLRLSDDGVDNAGGYSATVQCIFGPSCPLPFVNLPGSNEDLFLAIGLNGAVATQFPDTHTATGGDVIDIVMWSPAGTFTGSAPLIVADVRVPGTPSPSPFGFPELHVDFGSFLLWSPDTTVFGIPGLPINGINFSVNTPVSLANFTVIIQGIVLSCGSVNGVLAATDAHEFAF